MAAASAALIATSATAPEGVWVGTTRGAWVGALRGGRRRGGDGRDRNRGVRVVIIVPSGVVRRNPEVVDPWGEVVERERRRRPHADDGCAVETDVVAVDPRPGVGPRPPQGHRAVREHGVPR